MDAISDNSSRSRLFLGLKGTGTMWLDDIDYRYSRWNFTALERFRPYFARPLTLAEKITPTPKSFQRLNDVAYFNAGDPNTPPPLIVLPENPAPAEITAAALLRSKLETTGGNRSESPGPDVDIVQTPDRGISAGVSTGTRLEFCPPWYANGFINRSEGRAEIYFNELAFQIPPDVAMWLPFFHRGGVCKQPSWR